MVEASKLREMGLGRQLDVFLNKLHDNHKKLVHKQANGFMSMGCNVNYSFYEKQLNKVEFGRKEVEAAMNDLSWEYRQRGCDYDIRFDKIPGRKWYQFWKNDWEEKIINCLKLL